MLDEEELCSLRTKFESFSACAEFPGEGEFQEFLDASIEILEKEDSSYRPRAKNGSPGGFLDFSKNTLPVVIVPDIHGRYWFLLKLLDFTIPGYDKDILHMLNEGSVMIVCVGDGVHAEGRAYERWIKSYEEWSADSYTGESMKLEMKENIGTMSVIMGLKNHFPEYFHFLKGNHENITNENLHGNFSFRKFVQEGQMCCDFIRAFYGDVILHFISCWEKSLPICAAFSNFCVSHAEPSSYFKKNKIINCCDNDDVVLGLTWTGNDQADEGSVVKNFKKLLPKVPYDGVIWFGGHRPVTGKYALRQGGHFIQIHNPEEMNVAVVRPGRKFDPEYDIFSL